MRSKGRRGVLQKPPSLLKNVFVLFLAVLASLEETVPKALGELNAEEHHQLYEMLKVRLTAGVDGTLELNGKLIPKHPVCTSGTTPAVCPTHTTMAGPPIYAGSMPNPSGATTPTRTFWT
jgi:hypothetical protein